MIRKCFTKWEPVVDIVIPASRYNGVSPGPRQLPRCWAFVHFPPTPEGERAAADAIKNVNGTTVSELRVRRGAEQPAAKAAAAAAAAATLAALFEMPSLNACS